MGQGEKKVVLCPICKAPLDQDILFSEEFDLRYNSYLFLEDIKELEELGCFSFSFEACPNAWDDIHLKAILAREANRLDFCSICGRKVREKSNYTWLDHPRTAEAIEEMLGYQVPIKHVHHTSYSPEITIIVCDSCHAKIHHSDDIAYTQYRPKLPKRIPMRQRLHHEHSIENAIRYKNCFNCKNLDDTCEGGNSHQCKAFRYSDDYKIKIGIPITRGELDHGLH